MNQIQPQPTPPVIPPRPKDKLYWIILIIVAILVIGGATYIVWQGRVALPKLQNIVWPKKEAFADWQTYRNKDYGFEVKYPQGWQLEERLDYFDADASILKIKKAGVKDMIDKCIDETDKEGKTRPICVLYFPYFRVSVGQTDFTNAKDYLDDECEQLMQGIGGCHSIIGDTVVDGIKGKLAESCVEMASVQFKVVVKNNYVYKLFTPAKCITRYSPDYPENKQLVDFFNAQEAIYRDTFNQILSTFKFIEPEEIADWKTYRNEEYGFEMKHPYKYIVSSKTPGDIFIIEFYPEKGGKISDFTLAVVPNEKKLSLPEYLIDLYGFSDLRLDGLKTYGIFALKPAKKQTDKYYEKFGPLGSGLEYHYWFVGKEDWIFSLSHNQAAGILDTLADQILSTFKFIR